MRDLSLHILDLIENSIRAQAKHIALRLDIDEEKDRLRLLLEDDGCGLSMPPEEAVAPFRTTKPVRNAGLGLSLFKAATERAGGNMTLQSPARGVVVEAEMKWSHADRLPLGDIAETASGAICVAPGMELDCRFSRNHVAREVRSSDVRKRIGQSNNLALAAAVADEVRAAQRDLELLDV